MPPWVKLMLWVMLITVVLATTGSLVTTKEADVEDATASASTCAVKVAHQPSSSTGCPFESQVTPLGIDLAASAPIKRVA